MPVEWSTCISIAFELSAAWNSKAEIWTVHSSTLHGVSILVAMLRWRSNRWMKSSSSTHPHTSYTYAWVADKIPQMSIFNDMQSVLLDMGRTEIRASDKIIMYAKSCHISNIGETLCANTEIKSTSTNLWWGWRIVYLLIEHFAFFLSLSGSH